MKYSVLDLDAQEIAILTKLSRSTVNCYSFLVQNGLLSAELCEQSSPSRGVIEVDESYFGAVPGKGKRGRGVSNKIPVFGIFQRNDEVYTKIVSDCARKTLQAIIMKPGRTR